MNQPKTNKAPPLSSIFIGEGKKNGVRKGRREGKGKGEERKHFMMNTSF